jgi:hypothetical protein
MNSIDDQGARAEIFWRDTHERKSSCRLGSTFAARVSRMAKNENDDPGNGNFDFADILQRSSCKVK